MREKWNVESGMALVLACASWHRFGDSNLAISPAQGIVFISDPVPTKVAGACAI